MVLSCLFSSLKIYYMGRGGANRSGKSALPHSRSRLRFLNCNNPNMCQSVLKLIQHNTKSLKIDQLGFGTTSIEIRNTSIIPPYDAPKSLQRQTRTIKNYCTFVCQVSNFKHAFLCHKLNQNRRSVWERGWCVP